MAALPTGTVTFLFTDIEGSTTLLQRLGDRRYAEVLTEHQRLLRDAFVKGNGQEIDTIASIQHAISRSFYIAQAGLEEAKIQISEHADPAAYTTPAGGVAVAYGSGRFTYWVDAGPAAGCGPGLKTLESLGQVAFLGRTIPARVRACGVAGTPFLAALFGVSRIQFQGRASRMYLAPYLVRTPGGGGNLGSFTEINFSDNDVRLNALSEEAIDTVALRDGTFTDYELFGFSERPEYNPNPTADPMPWVVAAFGDIIKAQPTIGSLPNQCGTRYACVTVGTSMTDMRGIPNLRLDSYAHHAYMKNTREEALPRLALILRCFGSRPHITPQIPASIENWVLRPFSDLGRRRQTQPRSNLQEACAWRILGGHLRCCSYQGPWARDHS